MKDFIPEGEDAGSPTGAGGFRDFVPQEEIDAKRAKNSEKREEIAEEVKKAKKGGKKAKKAEEVPSEEVKVEEEVGVEKPVRGKKHNLK